MYGEVLQRSAEKYVKKGTQLYIEGRIKTRSYNDKDGNTRYITEIVGDTMQMLGKRKTMTHRKFFRNRCLSSGIRALLQPQRTG